MNESLLTRILGSWRLTSYLERPSDGSDVLLPMGEQPEGMLTYTRDWHISAQLMRPGRTNFASGEWCVGTDPEFREAASGYIAYAGTFEIDEVRQQVRHTIVVALFPNWNGGEQLRVATIEGDVLRLRSASAYRSQGKDVTAFFTWKRMTSASCIADKVDPAVRKI